MTRTSHILLRVLVLSALIIPLITACDFGNDSGSVTLEGRVVDTQNQAVSNAVVQAELDGEELDAAQTDEEGAYTLGFEVDETADVIVTATRDGVSTNRVVTAFASADPIEVRDLSLAFDEEEEEQTSGAPTNILLESQSSDHIGVKESGATEVAQITFQVADSTGRPVTLDHRTPVRFSFGKQPDGGEFIAPEEAETDNNGQVTANLSSGTAAGAVQIVAEIDGEEGLIRSNPISIAIHGGMPDQDHFTVYADQYNLPGLNRTGQSTSISVIAGDKYSNPVRPGTAVYFSSNHGVIDGSTQTDGQGRGGVSFQSANPKPVDGEVTVITAETAGENEESIIETVPFLYTGRIKVAVDPTTAELDRTYNLTVTDQNDNPLAPGTSIQVGAEGTQVQATGHTEVTLDDTEFDQDGNGQFTPVTGSGYTDFTFRAVADPDPENPLDPELETITINVSGPNGSLELVLTDDGEVTTTSDDAIVQQSGSSATVQLVD